MQLNRQKVQRWITLCDILFFLLVVAMLVLYFYFRTSTDYRLAFLWAAIPALVVRIVSYVLKHTTR